MSEVPVQAGTYAAELIWPEFSVVDGLVFFASVAPSAIDLSRWHDRTEIEATINHMHVLDCFSHRADLDVEPWWNQDHQDFKAACRFGRLWAEAVAAKLGRDFPERSFFVYYTEQDNPIVRFHQAHAGESPWLRESAFPEGVISGEVVVHRVCGYNNSLQARRP